MRAPHPRRRRGHDHSAHRGGAGRARGSRSPRRPRGELRMSADRPTAILDGVRVLEFASYIAGPYASMLLADLGAEVIKVEEPGQGDPFRIFRGDLYGPHFQAHNRGKRSLALNLRHAAAREIVDGLVRDADVLIENYRPGVAEALGIG